MSRDSIRVAVTTKIEALKAAWVGYPLYVEYDNTLPVNFATQANPFLSVQMLFIEDAQIDLNKTPTRRMRGSIIIGAHVKENSGSAKMNALLDYFYLPLQSTDSLYPVRTASARFSATQPKDSWVAQYAIIPFHSDSV